MALQLSSASKRVDRPGHEPTWADLPTPLLTHILQYIPQQQRLTVGALVSKAWATAAAAGSANVQQRITNPNSEGFQSWLAAHAGQMVSLQLSYGEIMMMPSLQLPWTKLSQLQCLHLQRIDLPALAEHSVAQDAAVQQGRAGTTSAISCTPAGPLLPRLKDLQLSTCSLATPEALVALVSQAPGLTRLVVSSTYWIDGSCYNWTAATRQRIEAAMCSTIQLLLQVTVLQLSGVRLGNAACQHLAALSNLQDLEVTLVQLAKSCRHLRVGGPAFDDVAAPVLAQLHQLHDLSWKESPKLTDVGLEQLTALTALTSLELVACEGLSEDLGDEACLYLPTRCTSKKEDGDKGPVCQQLAALCDSSLACLQARSIRQQAELQQQREVIREMKQQLESSKARVQQLEQQLAAAEAHTDKH